jgi:hypothetical protein
MVYKVNDQIEIDGKYYQCICADKKTVVFGPVIKKKDCLRTLYSGLIAYDNRPGYPRPGIKIKLQQWNGKSLKPLIPIKNATEPSLVEEGTLTVFTKKGKLVFKKGQYIKQVNGNILKP